MSNGMQGPDATALAVQRNFDNQRTTTRREKPYCIHCKMIGHSLESCFKAANAEVPICTHCNMKGHLIEKCYKLRGYPPGHKMNQKGNRYGGSANLAQSGSQILGG